MLWLCSYGLRESLTKQCVTELTPYKAIRIKCYYLDPFAYKVGIYVIT